MWSKKQIDASTLEHYKLNITKEELDKLIDNWVATIEDEKLVLSASKEIQATTKKVTIQQLKNQITGAKDINDIKNLLTNFIDL